MYKLLMVDDEEIIRRGFREKIDWHKMGFQFLEPCENGKQAIECIDKYQPDVIITDICMPIVNGLDVASYVAERYPKITVVILSGFDEFEYARDAIRFRVFEYVLKPITSLKLKNLLVELKKKLDREQQYQSALQRWQDLAAKSREFIQERFFSQLITGLLSRDEYEQYQRSFHELPVFKVPVNAGFHAIITLEPDHPEAFVKLNNGYHIEMLLIDLKQSCYELLSEAGVMPEQNFSFIFQTLENRLVIYLHTTSEKMMQDNLVVYPERILAHSLSLPYSSVTIGVGRVYQDLFNIHKSYEDALAAIKRRFIQGEAAVFRYKENHDKEIPLNFNLRKYARRFSQALKTESLEELKISINSFAEDLKKSCLPERRARLETKKFFYYVLDAIEQIGIDIESLSENENFDLLEFIEHPDTLDNVTDFLIYFCGQALDQMKNQRKTFSEKKALEVREFIIMHYQDTELSVEKVCKELSISASYLSRIFKKYIGKTFIEYLTEFRIEKAKEVMKITDSKNYVVAEMVGYTDPHYFCNLFKKLTGFTPSEYRNQLS